MIAVLVLIVLGIIASLLFFRKTRSNKEFNLFKKLCSEAVPSEYNRDHFAKSKFGYTLKFKKAEGDHIILAFNIGWSDFSLVSKEFEVEQFRLDERKALFSGSEDMGVSRISIKLWRGSGILEITHASMQSALMSKDQLIGLIKKININELEGEPAVS